MTGSLLAQLGATVVFVEDGEHERVPTKLRCREQFAAGKLSIALDADRRSDRDLLLDLVECCDVVLLSSDVDEAAHRPLPRSGAHANAIVCDLTAFGSTGPMRGKPYADVEIQALSGVLDCTGFPDQAPTPIEFPLTEYLGGIYAAGAVLCALRHRRTRGPAQSIEVGLYDIGFSAMSSFLAPAFRGTASSGSRRVGNRHTMAAPWNVYKARDGWILICAGSDDQWARICDLIGRHDLATATPFARNADRVARVAEVDAVVQKWVGRESIADCVRRFGELGIPGGPVVTIDGHPREANLEYRQMIFTTRDEASDVDIKVPGSPFRMTRSPGAALLRVPAPNQDRDEVARLVRARPATGPSTAGPSITGADVPPLAGVRVIEIGHYTTVPVATRTLAAMGAEVIKVEPPGGEAVRGWPPATNGQGVFFTFQNTDKKSVVVDLESDDGRDQLRKLIASADVLIENLRPSALAKRGFSPDELAAINPRLIYCSISGFGANSLYASRPAFDAVIQAMSGLMGVGTVNELPLKAGPSIADLMGAAFGFAAVVAALEHRDRTGQGQYLDLSMQDISAWATQTLWNHKPKRAADFDTLGCRDGYILVSRTRPVDDDEQGISDAPTLDRFEISRRLERRGIQALPVLTISEVIEAAQTQSRGLWFPVDVNGSSFPLLGIPFRATGTPPAVRCPAPELGRHNDEILGARA